MANQKIANNILIFDRDISEYEQSLAVIKQNMDAIFANMSELDTMWEGEANKAFIYQFNLDYENMLNFCQFAEDILESLKYAKTEYTLCENAVNSIVNAIRL